MTLLAIAAGVTGCTRSGEQEAVNILGRADSKFADWDPDQWINPIVNPQLDTETELRYDLSLLNQRHFVVVVLDGPRLLDYFAGRQLDIDQALLVSSTPGLSLKSLRSLILAFDDRLVTELTGGSSSLGGWFVQLDFTDDVDQAAWNHWLLGRSAETEADAAGMRQATDKSFALHWRSGRQLLIAGTEELPLLLSTTGHNGRSELAVDMLRSTAPSLVKASMKAAPLQEWIEQLSKMAESFGGLDAETQSLFDAVRALEKIQFHADLQDDTLAQLQINFLDQSAAKRVQMLMNQGIDQWVAEGPSQLLSDLPSAAAGGGAAPGMTQELRKLLSEILDELGRGGLSTDLSGRVVQMQAIRPQRLDELVDQGLAGIRHAQESHMRSDKFRELAMAFQRFQQDHGRYPAAAASPLIYGLPASLAAAELANSDHQGEAGQGRGEERGEDSDEVASTEELPLFSWRVALLPYLGHESLYQAFDFTQPWDSEVNRSAAAQMPGVFDWQYVPTAATAGPAGMISGSQEAIPRSDLQCLTGPLGALGQADIQRPEQISDGVDRTLLLAHTSHLPTPWTAPGGWEVANKQDLARWLQSAEQPPLVMMFSGRVMVVPKEVDLDALLAWVTPAGAERMNRRLLSELTLYPPVEEQ